MFPVDMVYSKPPRFEKTAAMLEGDLYVAFSRVRRLNKQVYEEAVAYRLYFLGYVDV